jgi:hypothetical protein
MGRAASYSIYTRHYTAKRGKTEGAAVGRGREAVGSELLRILARRRFSLAQKADF